MLDHTFDIELSEETTRSGHKIVEVGGRCHLADREGRKVSEDYELILRVQGKVDGQEQELVVGMRYGKRTPLVFDTKKEVFTDAPCGTFGSVEYSSAIGQFIGSNGIYKCIIDSESGRALTPTAYQDFEKRRDGTLIGILATSEDEIDLAAARRAPEPEAEPALEQASAPRDGEMFRTVREDQGIRIARDRANQNEYLLGPKGEAASQTYSRIVVITGSVAGRDFAMAVGERGGAFSPIQPVEDLTADPHQYYNDVRYLPELGQFVATAGEDRVILNPETARPAHTGSYRSFTRLGPAHCLGLTAENYLYTLDLSKEKTLEKLLSAQRSALEGRLVEAEIDGKPSLSYRTPTGRALSMWADKIEKLSGTLHDGSEIELDVATFGDKKRLLIPLSAGERSISWVEGKDFEIVEPGVLVAVSEKGRMTPVNHKLGTALLDSECHAFSRAESGAVAGHWSTWYYWNGKTDLASDASQEGRRQLQRRPSAGQLIGVLNGAAQRGITIEPQESLLALRDSAGALIGGKPFERIEAIRLQSAYGSMSGLIVGISGGEIKPLLWVTANNQGYDVRQFPNATPALEDLYFDEGTDRLVGGNGRRYQILEPANSMLPIHQGSFEYFEEHADSSYKAIGVNGKSKQTLETGYNNLANYYAR